MLVDAGKENYSYTDHVCKLKVILCKKTKNRRDAGYYLTVLIEIAFLEIVKNGGQS